MTTPAGDSQAARSLRFGQHTLFGVLLAVALLRRIADGAFPVHGWVAVVLTVCWYVAGHWIAKPIPGTRANVWLAVLVSLWLLLTISSPDFSWLAFPIFLLTVAMIPLTAALIGVTAMTVVVVLAQLTVPGASPMAQILGPVIGAVVAVGVGLGYQQVLGESRERGRLVAELVRAQDELADAHVQLADAQRRSGAVAERSRLARDLHDTLAQGFSSILLLARAGSSGEATTDDMRRTLGLIEESAAGNLAEVRAVVRDLAPHQLSDAPLTTALQRLLDRLSEETGIEARLRVEDPGAVLPTAVEVAVLRLVQGALANVRMHSRAKQVTVTLTAAEDAALVDVVDDGVGFDPARVPVARDGSGFGLRAMTERLAEIGGHLEIESAPGEGTAVAASIPLFGGRS